MLLPLLSLAPHALTVHTCRTAAIQSCSTSLSNDLPLCYCIACDYCRDLPLIPTAAAATTQQQQQQAVPLFAAPTALFDPRNPTLKELLDPLIHFPAPPFNGSISGSSIGGVGSAVHTVDAAISGAALLDGLVFCGLRTELDLQVSSLCSPSADTFTHYG